jgi:hypothetical protein
MIDRPEIVQRILDAGMSAAKRRTLCACVGLADEKGELAADVGLLAPMSGCRRPDVRLAIYELCDDGWLVALGEGKVRLVPDRDGD